MEDLERHLASHGLFLGAGGAPSWVVQFRAARVDGELPARLLKAYVHEGTLVGKGFGKSVTWGIGDVDLQRVADPVGRLNDGVIDMMMLVLQGEVGGTFFGSMTMPVRVAPGRILLCGTGVAASANPHKVFEKRAREKSAANFLVDYDLVILPVNLSNIHWVIAAIDMKRKRIETCDSCGGKQEGVFKTLFKCMQELYKAAGKTEDEFKADQWTHHQHAVPQQNNDRDCGLFALMFAAALAKGVDDASGTYPGFQFSAADIPRIRAWMVQTLCGAMLECGTVRETHLFRV